MPVPISCDYRGWSWETVATEWKIYRVTHPNATVAYRVFKSLTLLTALFAPPQKTGIEKKKKKKKKNVLSNRKHWPKSVYHRLRKNGFRSLMEHIKRNGQVARIFTLNILIAIGVLRAREAGPRAVYNHAEQLEKLGHQVDSWFFDDVLPSPLWPTRFRDSNLPSPFPFSPSSPATNNTMS